MPFPSATTTAVYEIIFDPTFTRLAWMIFLTLGFSITTSIATLWYLSIEKHKK